MSEFGERFLFAIIGEPDRFRAFRSDDRCLLDVRSDGLGHAEYNPLLDSSAMNNEHWKLVALDLQRHYDDWDSFVILHGTDTMAFTSSALAFMLGNLPAPSALASY